MSVKQPKSKPLVSIITGTYNSSKFVSDCVKSIYNQDYDNIEEDDGIYDAMNKGLSLANGEIVGILNSDDFYNSNDIINKVVQAFEDPSIDCVYGDLLYVEQMNTSKVVRKWTTGSYKSNAFTKGWHPAHPSFFVRNSVYKKHGYFEIKFGLAADFEIMLRILEKHMLKGKYLPIPMVRMRLGGASNKSLKNMLQGNKECIAAFKANDINVSKLYPFYRLIPKLKQYLK